MNILKKLMRSRFQFEYLWLQHFEIKNLILIKLKVIPVKK